MMTGPAWGPPGMSWGEWNDYFDPPVETCPECGQEYCHENCDSHFVSVEVVDMDKYRNPDSK